MPALDQTTATRTFGATSTTDEVLEGVDLSGKRVLVTGVSAGLGVETARALVAHGADVVGAARDLNKAKAATAGVRAAAGNGGGFDAVQGHLFGETALGEVSGCCSGRGAAAGIQRNEFLFLGHPCQYEDVAADAGAFGLDDVQDGSGRDGGVECVATLFEDLQAGLGGERLAGGDYAVAGQDF